MTGIIDPAAPNSELVLTQELPPTGYSWTTYSERLEKAGISWKVYQQEDNYSCNVLEYFKVFQESAKGSSLYSRGMLRGKEGQFEYDAIHDKLPAVSWIIPTSFQSEHPDYLPADGRRLLPAKLMLLRLIQMSGKKRYLSSPMMRMTASLIMYRRLFLLSAQLKSLWMGFRSAVGSGFLCIIVLPWTAGGEICSQMLITHRCFSFSKPSRAFENQTLANGEGALLVT